VMCGDQGANLIPMLLEALRRRPGQGTPNAVEDVGRRRSRAFSYTERFGCGTPVARASCDWLRPAATRPARMSTSSG
jgi:hypothetical protein